MYDEWRSSTRLTRHLTCSLTYIPQSTLVRALFLIICIDDLSYEISLSNIVLHSYDAKLFTSVSLVEDCLTMSDIILRREQWIEMWQMKVNVSKCECISIGQSSVILLT